MDDDTYLTYDSNDEAYDSDDYTFLSEDEDEEELPKVPLVPSCDVVLQIGTWRKPIHLENHRGGFVQDWYDEYGSPGAVLELEERLSFVRDKWPLLEHLREWEMLGPSIFASDGSKRRDEIPCLVRYSEVSPIARCLGTRMEGWELYTVMDRQMSQKDRIEMYRNAGRLMKIYDISMTRIKLTGSLSVVLDEACINLALRIRGVTTELDEIIEGIKHNARLRMMCDMSLRYTVPRDNRVAFSGVSNSMTVRGQLNWAYINWEDVAYLSTYFDVNTVTPMVLFLLGDMRQPNAPSILTSILPGGISVTEYALPILYCMRMDALTVYSSSGLGVLTADLESRLIMRAVANEYLSVETLSYYITQGAILAPSSETWAHSIVLDIDQVEQTVKYVTSTLGWFAAQVIHKLLSRSQKMLGPFGTLFLTELDRRLTPMLDLIDHYRSLPLLTVAENDVAGMLLSALPSPSHAAAMKQL